MSSELNKEDTGEEKKERISASEMSAYVRLDESTSDFMKLYDLFADVAAPWGEKRQKKEDEDYKED